MLYIVVGKRSTYLIVKMKLYNIAVILLIAASFSSEVLAQPLLTGQGITNNGGFISSIINTITMKLNTGLQTIMSFIPGFSPLTSMIPNVPVIPTAAQNIPAPAQNAPAAAQNTPVAAQNTPATAQGSRATRTASNGLMSLFG
ncbi:unnamed protein product [Nezara viridula]|uniref:Uncharacterized protein n=1 Tax=Nezara viridula TaxID=85310 RepID=A0A9P0HCK2_NEZVI|nr:unnamed protein product [Nezara viridula]